MDIRICPPSSNVHLHQGLQKPHGEGEGGEERDGGGEKQWEMISKRNQKFCTVSLLHVLLVIVVSSEEVCRC